MEVSKKVILQTLVPRIPGIIRTFILNKLGLSPCADKQDTRVELIVYIVRAFSALRRPVGLIQLRSTSDPGIRGRIWVAKVTAPADGSNLRDLVVKGIQILGGTGRSAESFILPDVVDVEGEWHGCRAQAEKKSPRPEGTELEHYQHLMREVTSDVTVLYLHGGAYFMMDPATHRGITYSLAKRTGGRCFSVRYRLAPQNPFPAALLDALTAYLYLLAPPEGSFHEPVPAKNIVISGDSAGANLASVLVLLLLTLRKNGVTSVMFHGKKVSLDLPAGLALNSPWCDIGKSLPSLWNNAKYDYIQPPDTLRGEPLPEDDVWPASPPRAEFYCQASLLMHPLVSPVIASSEMWKGCPPVFICGGNEILEDEIAVLARNMYLAGSAVEFHGYEGMPHCFAMVVMGTAVANDCVDKWAKFCVKAVEGHVERKADGTWSKARSNPLQFYDVKLAEMGLTNEVVREKLQLANDRAKERENEEVRAWEMAKMAK